MNIEEFKKLWTHESEYVYLILDYYPENFMVLKRYLLMCGQTDILNKMKYGNTVASILLNHCIEHKGIKYLSEYQTLNITYENLLRLIFGESTNRLLCDYLIKHDKKDLFEVFMQNTTHVYHSEYYPSMVYNDPELYKKYKNRINVCMYHYAEYWDDKLTHLFDHYCKYYDPLGVTNHIGPNFCEYLLTQYHCGQIGLSIVYHQLYHIFTGNYSDEIRRKVYKKIPKEILNRLEIYKADSKELFTKYEN